MALLTLTRIVLAVIALASCSKADTSANEFIFPGPSGPSNNFLADLALPLGSPQSIQWVTNNSYPYRISLFQQIVSPQEGVELESICEGTNVPGKTMSCSWTVQLYTSSLTTSQFYFLWLNPGAPDGFSCHYFNITTDAASAAPTTATTTAFVPVSQPTAPGTTSSSPSTSPTTSTSSSSTSASAAATSSALTSSPASAVQTQVAASGTNSSSGNKSNGNDPSSSNTVALAVGLGVGLGVGVPLVLIAGIFVGLKAVKQRKASSRGPTNDIAGASSSEKSNAAWDSQIAADASQPAPKYQLHASEIYEVSNDTQTWPPRRYHEMPSRSPRPPMELE